MLDAAWTPFAKGQAPSRITGGQGPNSWHSEDCARSRASLRGQPTMSLVGTASCRAIIGDSQWNQNDAIISLHTECRRQLTFGPCAGGCRALLPSRRHGKRWAWPFVFDHQGSGFRCPNRQELSDYLRTASCMIAKRASSHRPRPRWQLHERERPAELSQRREPGILV